jgi:uncharacterized protein
MRIYGFTDTHGDMGVLKKVEKNLKKDKPDIVVCCGDLVFMGEHEVLDFMESWGIKVLIVPGNHEIYKFLNMKWNYKNLVLLHKEWYVQDDVIFLGYGGGGFLREDEEFEELAQKFEYAIAEDPNLKSNKIVLLTHGPPANTKIDKLDFGHVGCRSVRKFIDEMNPVLVLSGHLHENFDIKDDVNGTIVANPGRVGKIFEV